METQHQETIATTSLQPAWKPYENLPKLQAINQINQNFLKVLELLAKIDRRKRIWLNCNIIKSINQRLQARWLLTWLLISSVSETFRKRQQVRAAVEQDKPIREIIESIEFCWLSRFEARRCLILALPMGVLIASAVQSAASPQPPFHTSHALFLTGRT